jgi:hypothetical protein
MGCPTSTNIGENLVFSICTHDPETGILTDADAAPTYRIYEDETATPILTGTMAKLDDGNTVGFYTESIACTAANGFEDGKTYTVYIEATVDGNTGGIAYGFKAMTPVWSASARTLTQTAAQVTAIVTGDDITVMRGDTITIALTGLGDISDRTKLWFTVKQFLNQADSDSIIQIEETAGLIYLNGAAAATPTDGSITVNNAVLGNVTIVVKAASFALVTSPANLKYDVQMLSVSGVTTMTNGHFHVVDDVTRAVA